MKKISDVNYAHSNEFHNEKAASIILPYVLSLFTINSIADFGCGTGSWLSAAKKLGVEKVRGIDGIRVDDDMLTINENEFTLHDLKKPLNLNEKFDLAICLEVAEHLPETAAVNIVDMLTAHSDVILFSTAIPFQTGDHHINEQWPSYWQDLLEKKGFYPYDILRAHFWNNPNVEWWYKQNIIIYSNKKELAKLGNPTKEVLALVHPDLLTMKEDDLIRKEKQIQQLSSPNFKSSLKLLVRSIIK
jgi:2-polyprenyl-3-methyl-5-hydroxy-6-metoxy-1,4-benzoquinol methylase